VQKNNQRHAAAARFHQQIHRPYSQYINKFLESRARLKVTHYIEKERTKRRLYGYGRLQKRWLYSADLQKLAAVCNKSPLLMSSG
jgi:hypothetical protein